MGTAQCGGGYVDMGGLCSGIVRRVDVCVSCSYRLVMCMVCSGDERSVEACFRRILSPRPTVREEAPSGAPAVDGRETEHRNFKST